MLSNHYSAAYYFDDNLQHLKLAILLFCGWPFLSTPTRLGYACPASKALSENRVTVSQLWHVLDSCDACVLGSSPTGENSWEETGEAANNVIFIACGVLGLGLSSSSRMSLHIR